MTTNKKMTKKEYFAILRESYPQSAPNYKDVIAFIDKEVQQLDRPRKATKTQTENEVYLEMIMEVADATPRTVTDFHKAIPFFEDFSTQKVAALVKILVDRGRLVKATVKGRSYFTLA